ncbi:unnamed protein product, partial [Arabidopsis lyrata]
MKLFDAPCHLQDKRVFDEASQLISALFSCRCYQLRSQWNLRERLGLGERDGRDVSFCCSLLWTTSLNLLIPLYLAMKLHEMKSVLGLASAASAERLPSFPRFTICGVSAVILLGSLITLGYIDEDEERHNFGHKGGFLCPFVPYLPVLCILINTYLIINIGAGTWIRVLVWLLIGSMIYLFYGRSHSLLNNA